MMIAHVVSAFCNYIFLTAYGIVLIAMTGTYYIVGLHICITSGLCCMNFVSLIVFSLVRYKYLFKVSWRFMILVIVVATVPPTVSGVICFILHFLTARSIQINVLGSMAIICTILMYLTRYFTLVGYKWWALVVAAVGIVNSLLWIVHFDHDSKLPYKIASSVGAAGRMIEFIILLYYSQHRPALHDIESQLLGNLDNKSGDNGGDHANENKNAYPPPLIILHEKMNDHSDGQLLGSANLPRCVMKALDSPLGARNCISIPSHVPSTASSPTVGALQESLKVGQVEVTKDHGLFPPKLGPSLNGDFDEGMIESSDMSLEDTSDVKDPANEDNRSAPSPPPTSLEYTNKQNYGGSFRLDDLPKSSMDAPDSTLDSGNFGLVPSHNLSAAIVTSPTVATHEKPLKIGKELGAEDCIPHPPRDGPVLNEAIGEGTTESSKVLLYGNPAQIGKELDAEDIPHPPRDGPVLNEEAIGEETTKSSKVSLEDASEVTNIINQVPETEEVTK
ncbi:unnamed protein product [Urochloa humidicola]